MKSKTEQDDQATFKPISFTAYYNLQPQVSHGDKCLDLYAKVSKGQYAKQNIEEPDLDFESKKDECNFAPTIN